MLLALCQNKYNDCTRSVMQSCHISKYIKAGSISSDSLCNDFPRTLWAAMQ